MVEHLLGSPRSWAQSPAQGRGAGRGVNRNKGSNNTGSVVAQEGRRSPPGSPFFLFYHPQIVGTLGP